MTTRRGLFLLPQWQHRCNRATSLFAPSWLPLIIIIITSCQVSVRRLLNSFAVEKKTKWFVLAHGKFLQMQLALVITLCNSNWPSARPAIDLQDQATDLKESVQVWGNNNAQLVECLVSKPAIAYYYQRAESVPMLHRVARSIDDCDAVIDACDRGAASDWTLKSHKLYHNC